MRVFVCGRKFDNKHRSGCLMVGILRLTISAADIQGSLALTHALMRDVHQKAIDGRVDLFMRVVVQAGGR